MGTKVQSKPYLPGSMRDLNNGSCNGMWNLCRDDRNSGSGNSQYYDSFLMRQAMDGYAGYAKEQMRQTILKQESIFRHQLQELHRLYKRQRDLMSEFTRQEQGKCTVPAETSNLTHFLSRVPSDASKETRVHASDFPQVDSAFGRLSTSGTDNIFSQFNSLKGKSTSKEFGPLDSKCSTSPIRVIDLELPADIDENNERNQQVDNFHNSSTKRSYNLADLNEPIQVEEASFTSPVGSKRCCLTEELDRRDLSANSSAACWFSSKFPQSNLMEKDGGICPSDSLIEGAKHKKEQLSYNFPDGKTKCYDSSYYNGIYSHQSNSLNAEPRKGIEQGFPISDQNKAEPQMKRTIFGVEICQRNQTPSFDSSRTPTSLAFNPRSDAINSESSFDFPWRKAASSCQNPLTLNHNRWLGSSDSSRKIPEYFAGNNLVNNNSRSMTSSRGGVPYQNGGCIRNSSAGVGFLSGINSKNSVSESLEQLLPSEKYKVTDEQKNHENPGKGLPPWLMAKPRSCGDQMKGKETTLYQMNLDSLQNHSQQFFKKAEVAKRDDKQELKTVKSDDCQSITKILGVPIIDVTSYSKDLVAKDDVPDPKVENHLEAKCSVKENGQHNCISNLRHHIDLNLSLNEDEAVPSAPAFPKAVVKIATTEIDLEAPAVLESETDSPETQPSLPSKLPLEDDPMDTSESEELVNVAAEAIVSISSSKLVHDTCQLPEEASADTSLLWLAEVITSHANVSKDLVNVDDCDEELIPGGMDYFEYMTLKLQDTNDQCYKPMILEEEKEEEVASLPKRPTRKGQGRRGRQRKDFQRDVLPSIVSLSRREVTEDLQTFEEVFTAIGVSWQSSLSKRKAAAKNGRGRRRLTVPESPSQAPPQPPAPAVQQSICREVALDEKSLSGWGKRTRRLPRQRCPNGGGTHQSLALKC